MAIHMNISEYNLKAESLRLSCQCGWEGKANEANGELHEAVMNFECPKCDKMLLIINLITDAQKYFDWKESKK
ncbi:hypothetical protein MWU78_15855 [Arenibacter sp. F26102]|uniref:hypothetical protein n=1 Tax=Arenibacter sp. F26102 TaxID=2926416 RepID=UPI001FF549A0|nr:hypothetical protein [Arenibacter sp. F26102]MCK0147132.1 hypothetical protein [Arenibacter sp. F26102]